MKQRFLAALLAAALVVLLLPGAAFAVGERFRFGDLDYNVLTDPVITLPGTIPGTVEVAKAYGYKRTSFTIPEFVSNAGKNYLVTQIGAQAFQHQLDMTVITITKPDIVTNIGTAAFHGCSRLTTASFPAAVSIGYEAFEYCMTLRTANFPVAESIGDEAFYRCEALRTASFPAVTSIGEEAFNGCGRFASLSLPATPPTVERAAFANGPAARSLTLVGSDGKALTGQVLSDAIVAYENDVGYDATTKKWYGWSLSPLPPNSPAPATTSTGGNTGSTYTGNEYPGSWANGALTVQGDCNRFTSLVVDNAILTQGEDYAMGCGSTVITFTPSYLATLRDGTHTVKVQFTDGRYIDTFTTPLASAATVASVTDVPDTGSPGPARAAMVVWCLCGACCVCARMALRKRRKDSSSLHSSE